MTAGDQPDSAALPACTLSITVAPTDVPFLGLTLPHLLQTAFRYPFASRIVVADVNPVSGSFRARPPGSIEGLLRLLADLRDTGQIDEVIPVDATPAVVRDAYRGVFAADLSHARDYRGAPILNYLVGLTRAPTRYVVHADGDMLLHQHADVVPWVQRGIELLAQDPKIGAVLPLSGPPHDDGVLHQSLAFERDPRGFFRFNSFTSRMFLVDRDRIAATYPLDPRWPASTRPGRRLRNAIRSIQGQSALPTWEDMMGLAFRRRGLIRADLAGREAWSLHPDVRGDRFVRWLPRIIEDVQAGQFPPAQAGHYNLRFEDWMDWYSGVPVAQPAG